METDILVNNDLSHGYESLPINTIFRGMNIHLPAIFMFTRGTRFWPTVTFYHCFFGFVPYFHGGSVDQHPWTNDEIWRIEFSWCVFLVFYQGCSCDGLNGWTSTQIFRCVQNMLDHLGSIHDHLFRFDLFRLFSRSSKILKSSAPNMVWILYNNILTWFRRWDGFPAFSSLPLKCSNLMNCESPQTMPAWFQWWWILHFVEDSIQEINRHGINGFKRHVCFRNTFSMTIERALNRWTNEQLVFHCMNRYEQDCCDCFTSSKSKIYFRDLNCVWLTSLGANIPKFWLAFSIPKIQKWNC